jgi:signal peptidase II
VNSSEARPAESWRGRRGIGVAAFGLLAAAVVIPDQIAKAWVVGNFEMNKPSPVIGDMLRIDFIHNNGGLFGTLQGQALAFAVLTVAVVAILVGIQATSGYKSWLITLTLGLLLGGAIGNFIDRIRLGYVIDFADIGIGEWRFYIFNIADSAITVSIFLMFVLWFIMPLLGRNEAEPRADTTTEVS